MATQTTSGVIDAVYVKYSNNQGVFVIDIDGTEVLRINIDDIESVMTLDGARTDQVIWARSSLFGLKWSQPIYFGTSFSVKARVQAGESGDADGVIVMWRENV